MHDDMRAEKEKFRKLQEQLSKSDTASREMDEQGAKIKMLDAKCVDLEV